MLYRISQLILELVTRILTRVSIHGRENIPEPPYIIASNHESYADPPLIGMAFRKHPVDFTAKQELFDMPLMGLWIRTVNVIPVRRSATSTESIKEVGKSAGSSADEETKFYRARLKHMLDFLNTFNRLFTAYLALEKFRFGGLTVPDMKRNHSENSV